jgi:dTDP-glucose 4,6-dehydratase
MSNTDKSQLGPPGTTRILVTGGLGAVGAQLVPELHSRGHDVWILDRVHSEDEQYLRADVGEYRQFENAVRRAEPSYVFHLAAEFGRWNGEDFYETLWRSNVIGNKHLIRLQEQFGFRTIFFSSSEVYGDWPNVMAEDVMDEEEIKQLNDYAISKWAGELQHLNAQAMAGLETVRVRLFNVYGPGEYYSPYRSALCRFLYSALKKEKFVVYRGHSRSWLYVTDAVTTLANIVDNFQSGEVYNIAEGTEYSMDDLAELVKETLNVPSSLIEYQDGEPFTTRTKHVDISKAVHDLGHQPKIPLRVGIERTTEWLRRTYSPVT